MLFVNIALGTGTKKHQCFASLKQTDNWTVVLRGAEVQPRVWSWLSLWTVTVPSVPWKDDTPQIKCRHRVHIPCNTNLVCSSAIDIFTLLCYRWKFQMVCQATLLRIQTEQDHLLRHFDANICVNHWGTFVQQDMRWEGMTFHKLTRVHCHCYKWAGYFTTAWFMNSLLRCEH